MTACEDGADEQEGLSRAGAIAEVEVEADEEDGGGGAGEEDDAEEEQEDDGPPDVNVPDFKDHRDYEVADPRIKRGDERGLLAHLPDFPILTYGQHERLQKEVNDHADDATSDDWDKLKIVAVELGRGKVRTVKHVLDLDFACWVDSRDLRRPTNGKSRRIDFNYFGMRP